PLEHRLVVGALAVDDLLLGVEALAAEAVVAAVLAEIDLAGVPELLEDRQDALLVALLGRTDEIAMADAERTPRLAECRGVLVGQRLRCHARLGRGLGDLVPVLVGPREEPDVVARQPPVAYHRVGDDGRVRVPQVGAVVHVVDRCRQVESGHCSRCAWMCASPCQVTWSSGTSASVPSGKPTTTLCLRTRIDLILPVMQPPPPQEAWQGVFTRGSRDRSSS